MDENNSTQKQVFPYDEADIVKAVSEIVSNNKAVSKLVSSSITDNLSNVLGIDTEGIGIKLSREDFELLINVHLAVYFGENIPQIAYELQGDIKNLIEKQFEGTSVKKVNIIVEGIDRRGES